MSAIESWRVRVRGDKTGGRVLATRVFAEDRVAATYIAEIMFPECQIVEPPKKENLTSADADAMGG